MTKAEIVAEMRSVAEKAEKREIPVDEARAKIEELKAKKIELEKIEQRGLEKMTTPEKNDGWAEVRTAMLEKRAITIGAGNGPVNFVAEVSKQLSAKNKLAAGFHYFYGKSAGTVIPVLAPTPAIPAKAAEGATNVPVDSTAVLTMKKLLPSAYYSILPVSAEALVISGIDFETELPLIFADAFGRAVYKGSVAGDGTFTGIAGTVSGCNTIQTGTTGALKLKDVVKLALSVKEYADDAVVVVHPDIISLLLDEATTGSDPIKAQLINGMVSGVPIVTSIWAENTVATGNVVAVAMPMSNYGVAMATEVIIEPIKVKGDTNTYFQATMFMNGAPIVESNLWQLAVK
jgi:HK97 family phage major capsid protein